MIVRYTTPSTTIRAAKVEGLVRLPDMRILAHEIELRLTPDVVCVVVDLREVEVLADAALVAALRGVRNVMKRRAGRLVLVARDVRLARLSRLAARDDVLLVCASPAEALDDRNVRAEATATAAAAAR